MAKPGLGLLFRFFRQCHFCHAILRLLTKHFTSILPLNKILETEHALVIQHPAPVYALHLLILPKAGWRDMSEVDGNNPFWAELPVLIDRLAAANHLHDKGYRLIINNGEYQDIKMLHVHFVSGEKNNLSTS